jgi:hypothetical protein
VRRWTQQGRGAGGDGNRHRSREHPPCSLIVHSVVRIGPHDKICTLDGGERRQRHE